jgi:hypothetical protein
MLMSSWESKAPWFHGLMWFGSLGVFQDIVSFFGLLCLGGWEQETSCILLILMLVVSSVRIIRRAIITFSLPTTGHPSYGWKLNPGLGFAEVWAPLIVQFGASILRGKPLLLEWKRSPSALLSIWYGKKGIEEFLKNHVLWWSLFFGDFRCYFTWYCTFMSIITF